MEKTIKDFRGCEFIVKTSDKPIDKKCSKCESSYFNGDFCTCRQYDCNNNEILIAKDKSLILKLNQIIKLTHLYIVVIGNCDSCDLYKGYGNCLLKNYICRGNVALKRIEKGGV